MSAVVFYLFLSSSTHCKSQRFLNINSLLISFFRFRSFINILRYLFLLRDMSTTSSSLSIISPPFFPLKSSISSGMFMQQGDRHRIRAENRPLTANISSLFGCHNPTTTDTPKKRDVEYRSENLDGN